MSDLAAGSLDPQGPAAEAMAGLWWVMLGLGTVVCVAVLAVLALGLLRRRPPPDAGSSTPAQRRFGRWFVVGGVVLPALIVLVTFAATVAAMRAVPSSAPPGALVVEVTGHQWWWEIRYPDHGVVTANELHVPVGEPVELVLTSADVIHSFWVPQLAGKMDLLPEDRNTLVLQADQPGEHHSQCAEFCGLQHTKMGLVVVAEPAEQFNAWVADQQQPAVEPATAAAQAGLDVFLGADCMSCHTIRGTQADGVTGPDLTHVASRPTLGATTLPMAREHLAAWITDPHEVKPGVHMPATTFDDADLDALVAYLDGLR